MLFPTGACSAGETASCPPPLRTFEPPKDCLLFWSCLQPPTPPGGQCPSTLHCCPPPCAHTAILCSTGSRLCSCSTSLHLTLTRPSRKSQTSATQLPQGSGGRSSSSTLTGLGGCQMCLHLTCLTYLCLGRRPGRPGDWHPTDRRAKGQPGLAGRRLCACCTMFDCRIRHLGEIECLPGMLLRAVAGSKCCAHGVQQLERITA